MSEVAEGVAGGSPAPARARARRTAAGARPRKRSARDDRAIARTLKRTFGIDSLRTGQERVIARVLNGEDTLAVMPTGAGKSLCYQLPALHLHGTTVVVSPLIALMKDQADKLAGAGVTTYQLNSVLSDREVDEALATIAEGGVRIVFATPERMTDPATLDALARAKVALLVVDEAHCISQWGHDFRPAYLELAPSLGALGDPPVLALTATATDDVIADIVAQLKRPAMKTIQTGVYRPNLHYRVVHVTSDEDRLARAIELVRRAEGSGIIYAATVRMAESLHEGMRDAGLPVRLYHGKLGTRERREAQDAFMKGDAKVMVATNAFGLGVDKPDIRFVVHGQMPGSIEAYYQESGRGGRDGEPARCTLLYDVRDRRVQQFFLTRRYPDAAQLDAVQRQLFALSAADAVPFETLRAALPSIAEAKIHVAVKLLADAGVAQRRSAGRLSAAGQPLDERALGRLVHTYADKADQDREKLERMVFYAQTGLCRWRVIAEYFDERIPDDRCGQCDNCVRAQRREREPAHDPLRVPRAPPRRRGYGRGDAVRVPRYGEGRVTSAAGEEVTVEFPDGAVRTFLRSYVRRVGGRAEAAAPAVG